MTRSEQASGALTNNSMPQNDQDEGQPLGLIGGQIDAQTRWIAMYFCIAFCAMAIAAKSAAVILPLSAALMLMFVLRSGAKLSSTFQAAILPAAPACIAMLFAMYAMISALWAQNSKSAFLAGTTLAAIILAGKLLGTIFARLTRPLASLIAIWIAIGLVSGAIILFVEMHGSTAMGRTIVQNIIGIIPSRFISASEAVEGGQLIDWSIANWSIGALNVFFWPVALTLYFSSRSVWRIILPSGYFAFLVLLTYLSEHQTSQLAIIFGLIFFALAQYAPKLANRALLICAIIPVLFIVPISQQLWQGLTPDNAPRWAQPSLQERFVIWGNVSSHVSEAPIIGIGANNTTMRHTSTATASIDQNAKYKRHHPHSAFLQVWLELGFVGAALILWLLVESLRLIRRLPSNAIPFMIATFATVLVQAAATWNFWGGWLQSVITLLFCYSVLAVRVTEQFDLPGATIPSDIWLPERPWAKLLGRETS